MKPQLNLIFMMNKQIKLFTLLLLLVMIIAGCKKEEISVKQVTINLAGDWEFNQEHLLGMWKPVYFAYTNDGKKISGRDVISSNYTVKIESTSPIIRLVLTFLENYRMHYSISSYFALLEIKQYVYYDFNPNGTGTQYDTFTQLDKMLADLFGTDFKRVEFDYNGLKIYKALERARSFVIRNDELFIYFAGRENENLLILKKN